MAFDKQKIIDQCNAFSKNTLMETLEIEFIDAGEDFLAAKMPVTWRCNGCSCRKCRKCCFDAVCRF